MFDAKSVATRAMVEAKRSGNKSNLGTALQIVMALDEAKRFESESLIGLVTRESASIQHVAAAVVARAHALSISSSVSFIHSLLLSYMYGCPFIEFSRSIRSNSSSSSDLIIYTFE